MLSKVKRSACYCTMDRTYYISSLQRCVQSTAVKITWNLWLASYLQRSLSSLKVHSTSTVKASFFFFFFFLSLIPRPSSHVHLGKRLLLFCFSYSSMYCLFFPFTLSLLDADVTSHLQGHCHWLVEMAVKVVSAITKATTDAVSKAVILIT